MKRLLLFVLLLLSAIVQCAAQEQDAPPVEEQREVIRSFDSQIELRRDGTMRVTETIRVLALNEQINHGIYRDFPTHYRDRWGERYNVKFEVVGARRDGHKEDWRAEGQGNGVRVYLGNKDVVVPVGEHTYEITYETDRQAGFFADHDELYWNATGNGWVFPIEQATAEVTLPSGVARGDIRVEAYTGAQGEQGRAYTAEVDGNGVAHFATTAPLESYQGMTIVVMFPKGVLTEPTREQRMQWFLEDNRPALAALIGLLLTLLYQFLAWRAVGKDPEPGTIVVRYEPPADFSPAAVRYLRRMKYDDKCFAALVVDMGVKRFLRIEQDSDGEFTLHRESKTARKDLTFDEDRLAQNLLGSRDAIALKQTNHSEIKSAIDAVKKALAAKLEQTYFVTNRKYLWPSVGLTVLTLLAVVATAPLEMMPVALFMTVWLSGWSVGVTVLTLRVAAAWKTAWHSKGWGKTSYFGALFITAFAIPFFLGELFGLGMFARATSIVGTVVLAALGVSNFVFHELLKAPTSAGRQLLDQIDGFREFIGATEDVERKYPLERSPATFEKFLPYAMAMDLEEVWTAKFASVLAAAAAAGAGTAAAYSPVWMNLAGSNFSSLSSLGSDLGGSLSSAISSSSTAPGSSSGGGGGGSSGGGGGGGGGGGW